MLSNKLTFSLVLVLMLAFATTSVMAQAVDEVDAIAEGEFGLVGRNDTPNGVDPIADIIATRATAPAPALTIVDMDDDTPNLANLLRFGGTIELQMNMGTATAAAAAAKGASADATADEKENSMWQKAVISEIMWAEDRPSDAEGNAQWIEIYNHTGAATDATSLRLAYYSGRNTTGADETIRTVSTAEAVDTDPADGVDDTAIWVLVDRVSTVNRFGALWAAPGQSGNSAIGTGADADRDTDVITDFISMYRKINLAADGTATYKVQKAADGGGLDGIGDGTDSGQWAASEGAVNTAVSADGAAYIATPFSVHRSPGGVTVVTTKAPATILATGITFNEIRNDTSDANLDWIELFYNGTSTDAAIDIGGYEIQLVVSEKDADGKATGVAAKETTVVDLPAHKMSPGDYFVVYNRSPADTILAGGVNVGELDKNRRVNKGASHAYSVADQTDADHKLVPLDLPSDDKFLLVLRSAADQDNEPDAVKDYIGNGFFTASGRGYDADHFYNTSLFPLNGWPTTDVDAFGDATFASASQSWGRITELNDDGVYWPKGRADHRGHDDEWQVYDYMGTGYDRNVDTAAAPGTPGYANISVNVITDDRDGALGADKTAKSPYAFSGMVTISEVMYDAGPRWNLIQWIELYNSSMTETIDLTDWEMEIRNESTDVESYVDSSFVFEAVNILPNQTLLLVSGTGANDVDSTRVYNLNQRHRRALGLQNRDSRLLSAEGFALKLWARVNKDGETLLTLTDEAGNVDVKGAARIHMWDLTARGDVRMSIVRQYGSRELDDNGPDDASDGMMETSWMSSDITGAGLSYYGHRNDVSTPGFRLGGPLPVSLSSFRPVRNQTTGHVDITWITQSELNNAGFNILRSDSKGGEFKVINVKGIIAGHGTTSEKHVYTYTDTTAKPNVVYYYQIEDVSLNGQRTPLRTTHLRGNVTAGGKLTTTWGDLKLRK